MTKNQLIKKLQKIKGNPQIIVSSDMEGNSFSELYDVSGDLFWDKENRIILDEEDFAEDGEGEYGTNKKNFQKCIVLWPN